MRTIAQEEHYATPSFLKGPGRGMAERVTADPISHSAKPFCSRRSRCSRLVPNVHGTQSTREDAAIIANAVSDHVAGASSQGDDSVIRHVTHSAAGFFVTLIQTSSLRSIRTMTNG